MARHKTAPDDPIVLEQVTATVMRSRGTQGDRYYWRIRTRNESRRTVAAGWWTRAEAEAVAADRVRQGLPSAPAHRVVAARTVADLLNAWTEAQQRRAAAGEIAPLTLKNYRQSAEYWNGAVGDVVLSRLTREMVEDQVTTWQAAGVAPRTCEHAVTVLKGALRWGASRGHIDRPPDLSRLLSLRVRRDEFVYAAFTPTRQQATAAISRATAGRDRDLLTLLSLTGCRIGEAAALRVGDVDLVGHVLTISGRDDARGRRGKVKPRRWPIAGELAPLLERLMEGRALEEPLITDMPDDASAVARRALRLACERAEVPRFTAHALRRMVAMELLEVADPRSVSELTGHTVAVLLERYVRPTRDRLRDVVLRAGIGQEQGKVIPYRAQRSGTGTEDVE